MANISRDAYHHQETFVLLPGAAASEESDEEYGTSHSNQNICSLTDQVTNGRRVGDIGEQVKENSAINCHPYSYAKSSRSNELKEINKHDTEALWV